MPEKYMNLQNTYDESCTETADISAASVCTAGTSCFGTILKLRRKLSVDTINKPYTEEEKDLYCCSSMTSLC